MNRGAEYALAVCLLALLGGCAALTPPHREAHPTAESPQAPAPPPAPEPAVPAQEPPLAAAVAPEPPAAETLELLRDAQGFADLAPDAQHQALAEAETRSNVEQTPRALVRYALLLCLSDPDRQASVAAASRLRELPATMDADLATLAQLVLHMLDEREHLLAQNTELQRKLNQLKAIEQQLGDRDGAVASPVTP